MTVGFTGTRKGLSETQRAQLWTVVSVLLAGRVGDWHHGGAEGADREADALAHPHVRAVVIHPCPGVVADRAPCDCAAAGNVAKPKQHGADQHAKGCAVYTHPAPVGRNGRGTYNRHEAEWREVLPPLVRNARIVQAADLLIAAPEQDIEQLRSGTWATVRAARKKGIPVIMLLRGEA